MTRLILASAIAIHGIIHFMGFAASIGRNDKLQAVQHISRPSGFLWLVVVFLFIVAASLVMLKRDWWHIGFAAIMVSECMIMTTWESSKWGTILNVVLLLACVINFADWKFRNTVLGKAQEILTQTSKNAQTVTLTDVRTLPPVVQKWLMSVGVVGKPLSNTVRLRQAGRLRTKPGAPWMPVTATQYFSTDKPSFIWAANINNGVVSLSGLDEYSNGTGSMQIRLSSIYSIADAHGPELDQGTLLRYLAEIQWFPSAAFSNYIVWKQTDNNTAVATISYGGKTAEGTFTFDTIGNLRCFEAERYMEMDGTYTLERWSVPVIAYRDFEGIRVPSKGHTIWKLKTGDFNWFDWEITDISYNPTEPYSTAW